MRERPRFPWRALLYRAVFGTVAAVGVLQWLVTTPHLWKKLVIIGLVLGGAALSTLLPFLMDFGRHTAEAIREMPRLPERLRQERASTWLAVEANVLFDGLEIEMSRLKLNGADVLVLLNVGSLQGLRKSMLFEIVAVPDMEVYGVVKAEEVGEEATWCVLEPNEGNPNFGSQMHQRLDAGDVAPPDGYQVRPFMADSYRYVERSMAERAEWMQLQNSVAVTEESGDAE